MVGNNSKSTTIHLGMILDKRNFKALTSDTINYRETKTIVISPINSTAEASDRIMNIKSVFDTKFVGTMELIRKGRKKIDKAMRNNQLEALRQEVKISRQIKKNAGHKLDQLHLQHT